MSTSDTNSIRDHVKKLLGVSLQQYKLSSPQIESTVKMQHGTAKRMIFTTQDNTAIQAILLEPTGASSQTPSPAILYCHAHGARYDIGINELCDSRPALVGPYAEDLLALGFVVLCLEMPCFGSRSSPEESAASKTALWYGKTLFGQMLAELSAGLDYLCDLPQVDSARIGTLGISMGGTHAWWLAALDTRIKTAAHLCCFADLATLVKLGNHDNHGHYMTVPGLLAACSSGQLAGLIAPRAQFCGVGLKDWSSPPDAFKIAQDELIAAYGDKSDLLTFHIEPEVGHEETPAMRAAVLTFLKRRLIARPI
jgi:hypothetical protein